MGYGKGKGGGRGRKGSGDRGSGGKGGGQRWWDPEWRAAKLAEMRANRGDHNSQELDIQDMLQQLDLFKNTAKEEMHIRENYGREGAEQIHQLASHLHLHSKAYGRGRSTVLVVSKKPLPNYRADLDDRRESHEVSMSADTRALVASALCHQPRHVQQDGAGRTLPDGVLPPPGLAAPGRAPAASGSKRLLQDAIASEPITLDSEGLREEQRRQRRSPIVQDMLEFRKKLPAFHKKTELLAAVGSSQVLVVSGETGCGKTTQLPQFLLEEAIEAGAGGGVNIVCTQPRRISAISVAQRVAQERGEQLGRMVGYQIRLEAKRSAETRLLFCTSGVLLRRLVQEPSLQVVPGAALSRCL
ncbi:hypothetical protein CYMTET_50337 [Cymbomonas tetramitiformis]|uniref:Helicase ATP-binding domain-containing protein n=1 Tax=Cymbomonas tetramitiformis TaxID=36881 RepID=A0AAE0ETL5_9CHLO|nr:hypothetical protein CYMTET_50337 [Cymbomonas tetramitiformis]